MNWWKLFKARACSVGLKHDTKDEILAEIVDNMVKAGVLPEEQREAGLNALLERERLASTGVGMNVAIPHVQLAGLERAACSLSVHKEGVEWSAVDGAPVHILFTVLRPARPGDQHDPEKHLEMMRWVAKLAREPDFRRFALKAKTKTDMIDLLKEMSTV